MSTDNRLLAGRCIGISISESEDLPAIGLDARAVNDFTVDICRRLIALGACVVLGHDWRAGGIMESVTKFALAYRGEHGKPSHPLIQNVLAAPDMPGLSEDERKELQSYVVTRSVTWAPEIRTENSESEISQYSKSFHPGSESRAANLFAMRYELAKRCDIRLVIGGRILGHQGKVPGLIEEAWLTMESGKPVLCSTGLGGVAERIVDPSRNEELPWVSHAMDMFRKLDRFRGRSGRDALCIPSNSLSTGALIAQMVKVLRFREDASLGDMPSFLTEE
ncbi:hypothetical protein [Verrucomicrobium sp. BvORR106]|uniref:hypothetical protein n=1 Tax=Verrucomicrobium sp. BvORR106 TaxID=1403819 RepID=UPI000570C8BE|nr:hypothetical protein [Verrucomicrobium sp. BvORR106]